MRRAALVLVCALAACGSADPAALAERQWEVCETSLDPHQQIEACSAVIGQLGTSDERRATALINRGAQRADLSQHVQAIADFGRALRIDPNNAHARLERGMVHHDRGAYDSALGDYDAALSIDPRMQMALERRQAALAARGQAQLSQIEQLTRALASDPRNAILLNNRCWQRAIGNDNLELALADCNAALAIEPDYAAALDSRGLVHLKQGAFEAAIADYDAALAADAARGHYLYGRGVARLRLGLKPEGQADLAAGEQAEPGVARLYAGYGIVL